MTHIPLTFQYKQKEYNGILTKVPGAADDSRFDLMVDGYNFGMLFYNAMQGKWKFYSNSKPELSEQEDYFGQVVMAWREGVE